MKIVEAICLLIFSCIYNVCFGYLFYHYAALGDYSKECDDLVYWDYNCLWYLGICCVLSSFAAICHMFEKTDFELQAMRLKNNLVPFLGLVVLITTRAIAFTKTYTISIKY